MKHARLPLLLVPLLAIGPVSACSSSEPPPAPAPPTVAAPLALDPADPGLEGVIWRYLDPASGEVKSATDLDTIPESARGAVVVFDPRRDPPPGQDWVADLSRGLPTTATPVANFSFPTRASLAPVERRPAKAEVRRDTTAAREVVMFSTQGCGYCAKARKFLTQNRIPFTELDVEEDMSAASRLKSLGDRAGLTARQLQGVPILFIDGKPLIGWDERQASRLLGLSG